MEGRRDSRGFSLIEAVIAAGIVCTAMGVLASLASLALGTTVAARDRAVASILAHAAFERLVTGPPGDPPAVDTLASDVPGWVEYLDSRGGVVGRVFARRWRIDAWRGHPDLRAVHVVAGRCRLQLQETQGCTLGGDAIVVTAIRTEAIW
jgi:hypothetical protein